MQISLLYYDKYRNGADVFINLNDALALETVEISETETEQELKEYFDSTESDFVFIYNPRNAYSKEILATMVRIFTVRTDVDIVISPYAYMNEEGRISSSYFSLLGMGNCVMNAQGIRAFCADTGVDIFANIGCALMRKDICKQLGYDDIMSLLKEGECETFTEKVIDKVRIVAIAGEELAASVLKRFDGNIEDLKNAYDTWSYTSPKEIKTDVGKKITFFYTDKGEYYNLAPLAEEAKQRGYEVEMTGEIKKAAEIGVYCQHVCYPENSKFSVILLHDMAQGHNRWPNIWEIERWNKFDIGILPGQMFANLWKKCGELFYANPRYGVYAAGYPKSDIVKSDELNDRVEEVRNALQLKHSFSVLYAPSWENDQKEDDFVRALVSLPVNLIIKQAHWPAHYQFVIDNITEMRTLHDGKYENVYYIEPEESIMTALKLCDMVVSDESSVMAEALMFDKVSVAVTDWTIPDTNPPRLASVPMDYVIRCKRVELRETVEKILNNKMDFSDKLEMGRSIFGNRGNVCKDILDMIEYYTGRGDCDDFMKHKLLPDYLPCK